MISIQRIIFPLVFLFCLLSGSAHAGGVQWLSYEEALKRAQTDNTTVYLYFYSNNCPWCIRTDKEVFASPEVSAYLNNNFLNVRISVEEEPLLASRYRIRGFPAHVFLSGKSKEVLFSRPGYMPPGSFLRMLQFLSVATEE